MPRKERELMDLWEFTLDNPTENKYQKISLPHDWVINAPFNKKMEQGGPQGYRDRWSIGWYKRPLELSEKKAGYKYFLDFGGIFENSTIWINGTEAGGHKYGYSPFRLDVTDFLQQGNNEITIKVDNTTFPADRWYSGGGIYRTVKLIEVENMHFDEQNIIVRSSINGSDALISVDTAITGKVKALLSGHGASIEAESADGRINLTLTNARLWSAETPDLYFLELQLMDGERTTDIVR